MNYSSLMTFAVIGFSIVYYFIWGKKQYKGPLLERGNAGVKGARQESVGGGAVRKGP